MCILLYSVSHTRLGIVAYCRHESPQSVLYGYTMYCHGPVTEVINYQEQLQSSVLR